MEELAASVDLFLHKPREIEDQKRICAACAADKNKCICKDDRRDRKATKRRTRLLHMRGVTLGVCAHWMPRKDRPCGFPPPPGRKWCREHDPELCGRDERMPCPIDPSHKIFKRDLEAHLKVCETRKDRERILGRPWYSEGCNAGGSGELGNDKEMGEKELLDKLRLAASDKVGEGATGVKSKRARHKTQASLIVDTALRMAPSLLNGDDVAVVDLGAGKGGLADAVVANKQPGAVVFVERESRRHKADGKLRRLEALEVERVRGDLADIDLARVGTLRGRVCVGVAKHLCGSATDLALNAFVALSDARGVAVATCCHHRCEWSSYVGRDYFRKQIGGSAADFARIARWSSWACQVENGNTGEHAAPVCADDLRDYTTSQKREIGRRCKALLDAGRLDFLRRHGLAGSRRAYCDVELSPENWLLVAERCVPCADAVLPVVRKSPCSPVLPRKFEEGVCGCVVI